MVKHEVENEVAIPPSLTVIHSANSVSPEKTEESGMKKRPRQDQNYMKHKEEMIDYATMKRLEEVSKLDEFPPYEVYSDSMFNQSNVKASMNTDLAELGGLGIDLNERDLGHKDKDHHIFRLKLCSRYQNIY